jgi:hypothetical protein
MPITARVSIGAGTAPEKAFDSMPCSNIFVTAASNRLLRERIDRAQARPSPPPGDAAHVLVQKDEHVGVVEASVGVEQVEEELLDLLSGSPVLSGESLRGERVPFHRGPRRALEQILLVREVVIEPRASDSPPTRCPAPS